MRVVTAGLETHEQLAFLQNRECPIGQGHYFSQPLPGNVLSYCGRGIPVHDLQLQAG
jgi:EAL domain-containing protein (putative c-di-GMP-specific phosphodiesterase class I)